MPLIDYDLHPVALAFGIFCFVFTAALIATVVYIGTRDGRPSPSASEPSGAAPPFLSDDAPAISEPSREARTVTAEPGSR